MWSLTLSQNNLWYCTHPSPLVTAGDDENARPTPESVSYPLLGVKGFFAPSQGSLAEVFV